MLLLRDDDTLALILQHCTLDLRSLQSAAASCRRLCDVARAHRSYTVRIRDKGLHQLPAISASTIGPFAGCTCLEFRLTMPTTNLLDGGSIAAALTAPGKWPRLGKLDLVLTNKSSYYHRQDEDYAGSDKCYGSLVSSLGSLPQLRELVLEPVGPRSLATVGAATQLTRLGLQGVSKASLGVTPDSSTAPSADNVQHSGIQESAAAFPGAGRRLSSSSSSTSSSCTSSSNSSGGCSSSSSSSRSKGCLPSSLVSLDCHLDGQGIVPWLANLSACPNVQRLYIKHKSWQYPGLGEEGGPPPTVLDLAAQHAPGLTSLGVCYPGERRLPRKSLAPLPVGPRPQRGQPKKTWLPFPPLLAQLTRLQVLSLSGLLYLYIDTNEAWSHFGCLSALQKVTQVHIQRPPPAGMRLPSLTLMWGSASLSGADTRALLAACPGLESLQLEVHPQPEQQGGDSSDSTPNPSTTSSSSSSSAGSGPAVPAARLGYVNLMYVWGTTAEEAAAHFAATAPAMAGLPDLDLEWPQSDTSPHLPDFGGLTALTYLSLAGASSGGCAQEQDILQAVKPLSGTLKELWLSYYDLVTPRAALGLQGLLPALQRVVFRECGPLVLQGDSGSEEEDEWRPGDKQMQLLKSQLRPGLELSFM